MWKLKNEGTLPNVGHHTLPIGCTCAIQMQRLQISWFQNMYCQRIRSTHIQVMVNKSCLKHLWCMNFRSMWMSASDITANVVLTFHKFSLYTVNFWPEFHWVRGEFLPLKSRNWSPASFSCSQEASATFGVQPSNERYVRLVRLLMSSPGTCLRSVFTLDSPSLSRFLPKEE